jgi:hypothetical protein
MKVNSIEGLTQIELSYSAVAHVKIDTDELQSKMDKYNQEHDTQYTLKDITDIYVKYGTLSGYVGEVEVFEQHVFLDVHETDTKWPDFMALEINGDWIVRPDDERY